MSGQPTELRPSRLEHDSVDNGSASGDAALTSVPTRESLAREFFDRPYPPGYLADWSRRLIKPDDPVEHTQLAVVIMRLHAEYLALSSKTLTEITLPQPIHVLPHRSNQALLGLVNIRGQLRLCVSLHGLLGIEPPTEGVGRSCEPLRAEQTGALRRLVIAQDGNEQWVFPVEEVMGVHRLAESAWRDVPATMHKASSVSRAVFEWNNHTVGLIDEFRLLAQLRSACE